MRTRFPSGKTNSNEVNRNSIDNKFMKTFGDEKFVGLFFPIVITSPGVIRKLAGHFFDGKSSNPDNKYPVFSSQSYWCLKIRREQLKRPHNALFYSLLSGFLHK